MLYVAVRETLVLLLGVVMSLILSLLLKNLAPAWSMAPTLVLPLALCIIRAGWTKIPHRSCTMLRYILASFFVAGAIVVLFLFEIMVGVLATSEDLPPAVWLIPAGLAVVYVTAYVIAWQIGSEKSPSNAQDDLR